MSDDNESLIHKIEHFFDKDAADDMVSEGGPVVVEPEDGGPVEYNPPAGWVSEPPPDTPDEGELLEEAFGKPDADGFYAPNGVSA